MIINETTIQELKKYGDVKKGLSFKQITTIKIGGEIAAYFTPNTYEDLARAFTYFKSNNLPYKVIGRGSDLVCGDRYYDGVVISLKNFNKFKISNLCVEAQAGCSGMLVAKNLAQAGLKGFEFASAIPGSIGGMIYMNAGAYKSDMSEVVEEVLVCQGTTLKWLSKKECQFSYRSSIFQQHLDWFILAVRLKLVKGDKNEILALHADRLKRRQETQPLNFPSAGSCFRNPQDNYSWFYIAGVGLRGYQLGGIKVSEKHPNFIINISNASAQDFLDLTKMIQEKVFAKYGINLIREVEIFNCY